MTPRSSLLRPLPILAGLTAALSAQTPLSGTLGGTLAPGVYHTTTDISIAVGQTLTLPAGVIIKLSGHTFTVDGTLVTNGTAANPVIFTHIQDDSAGGDTNGNGASTGSATGWYGIVMNATASGSSLTRADIRYGGANFVSNLELNGCNATFSGCVVRNNFSHGMDLNGSSRPTVTNCAFTANGGLAVANAPLAALVTWNGNTATGNQAGSGNFAQIVDGSITQNLTLGPANAINGVLVTDADLDVAANRTFTLQAGTIVKFRSGHTVNVAGTLRTNGIAGSPVVFTDFADDSAGGDTNGNGASIGSPTSWFGIVFASTASGSILNHADVRYGGASFVSNLELNGCNATFTNCVVRNNFSHGMDLNGNSRPTVTNCTFTDNGNLAVANVPLAAMANWNGNAATGNQGGTGNYAQVVDGAIAQNLTLGPANLVNGVLVTDADLDIAANRTFTLQAGTIVKFRSAHTVKVAGTLRTNGIAGSPVVFTDFADDSAGGDTNGNGASSGTWTSWFGIVFASTANGSILDHADVRYGGANFVSNIELNSASPTLRNCVIRDNFSHGMDLNSNSRPTVTNCVFTNNGGLAIANAPIDALPGLTNNTATGNQGGTGNFLQVTTGNVASSLRIGSASQINGVIVLDASIVVAPAATLIIEQGVAWKVRSAQLITVNGSAQWLGTSYEPIVFTDFADDSVAGDSNGNGASGGSPTSWFGVTIAGSQPCQLENVVVRFGGANFQPGLTCSNPQASLRAVRVDRCFGRGFVLSGASLATNLVAWSNGSDGFHLTGGNFNLVHATAASNGTGIRRDTTYAGTVVNSISRGNATNFTNFPGAQVFSSCGFSGGTGNLDVDPQFVSQATGDLHLLAGSPCLGAADLVFGVLAIKDHDENSRVTDHLLNGIALPDMGAFERQVWSMSVTGTPRPGSTITFQVDGQPGLSFWAWGVLDGVAPINPYGVLLVGDVAVLLVPFLVPTGTPLPLPLTNDPALVGAIAGFQTLTFPTAGGNFGNLTRLYRGLVRP
ncbi:MAG: right-handed parallel beta-helix repeat-containing protein [Planctomycetes bacterium]|jgi:parallel beta-helix repeat protein|nr:right-handed parallel beta-helix repeat-containing protein [Planctomycetota bacterium]